MSLVIKVRSYTLTTLLEILANYEGEAKRILEAIHDNTIICRTHSMHVEEKAVFDPKVLFLG
jgi:hypothetical protein